MPAPDKITQLLDGTYEDPDGLGQQRVDTRSLVIAPRLDGMERDLVQTLDLGRHVAVVSDATTHRILGKRVEHALDGAFSVQSLVLPEAPHPDDETVAVVRQATARADALIAIGSGTINDLCKFASAQDKKPYAVFATAPSMNGYTSVNAAITVHGHKKSLEAHAPRGAFFDLAILAAAPARLIRSGLGDSLCRATSQADWLLAHRLLDQPYRQLPYALLEDDEAPLFAQSAALLAGDIAVMERLVRTLVLSGFGTAIHGNSQPASQGEHLISHYIDMLGDAARPLVYHGEQIGVTTLSMARLQQAMLKTRPRLTADSETLASFAARYGATLGASCWADFARKRLDAQAVEKLNDRLATSWTDIAGEIAAVALTPEHLEKVLTA
ncbi:MAG TPA: iron-containing alcohol dehydrogenase, partial [Nordella sp.]|nr:iron-containing alcohol dehydrogenase [Nordella sp.]